MEAQISAALTELVKLVVLVLVLVITSYIRLHFSTKQIQAGTIIADSAVGAAEQMAAAGIIDPERKKLEAIAAAKVLASKAGISLSDDQWSLLIEAAVKVMKDSESELKKSAADPAEAGAT